MTIIEFRKMVVEKIDEFLPYNVVLEERDVPKNNGVTRYGLGIVPDSSTNGIKISPVIYMESFYERYLNEESLDEVLESIADAIIEYSKTSPDVEILHEDNFTWENVKDTLRLKAVNCKNKDELTEQGVVFREVQDLVVYPIITLGHSCAGFASTKMTRYFLNRLPVSEDEVFDQAYKNMEQEIKFQTMAEILSEMMGGLLMPNLADCPMWVISTKDKTNGAALITSDAVMRYISDTIKKSSFIVLPSSIHECIVVPDDGGESAMMFAEMVSSINSTELAEEDVLSDHPYRWSAGTGLTFLEEAVMA